LGVDVQVFKPAADKFESRREFAIPSGRIVLLYVGRLAPEKNVKVLLQAFAQLNKQLPGRFHAFIVGDGFYREDVIELQKTTRAITWMRYCSDQLKLAKVYRAADLFVHPGVQETFGLVALESQSCGTPVVGIHGSYMDRIIFADQSHWAKENSAESLALAVLTMSKTDLEKAGLEASRRVARRYSWQTVFERMFDIYQQLAM
jgi:alpha-1,6-mannosyltransferase